MTCPQCHGPLTEIGVMEGLLDETVDEGALLFAERVLGMGLPVDSRWLILECQRAECGCRCRRYHRLETRRDDE